MIKKYRTQQIIIDLPLEDSLMWIHGIVQTCYKNEEDYKTNQVVDRTGRIHRQIDAVAKEMITFTDPITEEKHTLSIGGIAFAIKAAFVNWIIEDFGGEENEKGDICTKVDIKDIPTTASIFKDSEAVSTLKEISSISIIKE